MMVTFYLIFLVYVNNVSCFTYDSTVYYVNNKLMTIKWQYKISCLQVFFRISVLKNSEGSQKNIGGGGLKVFNRFFINTNE